ncbi:MAG: ATP-binding domain-containing protein [Paludibacteraceae bacterium]|nr:ATP-binding domain-containing protein [Paludibacteraceae bacterium]
MAGYYFNLPAITQLTIPQQAALNETRPIALSGGPGTGKSVVSLWRHISNYEKDKRSLLLTYTTTLKQYLKACCEGKNTKAALNVGTSYRNRPCTNWSEIIVDEAQDLEIGYYMDIRQYGSVSYGADDSQILYPNHCSKQADLESLFPTNVSYVLNKNFRSTQRIMQFARQAFPSAVISQRIIDSLNGNLGEWPVLLISNGDKYETSNSKQDEAIVQIVNSYHSDAHNIAILVPFEKDVRVIESVLNNRFNYSSYCGDDYYKTGHGCGRILNIHITTFKSAKGLEFDTVIIPNFHKYREICGSYNTDWNDFYVACTRARSNLYLISNYDLPNLNSVTDKQVL